MKINITYDNFEKVIVAPEGVHFLGVTVKYGDITLEALTNRLSTNNEEIVLNENLKIILHYYDSPEALEIREAFNGYNDFEFIEIHDEKFSLIMSV